MRDLLNLIEAANNPKIDFENYRNAIIVLQGLKKLSNELKQKGKQSDLKENWKTALGIAGGGAALAAALSGAHNYSDDANKYNTQPAVVQQQVMPDPNNAEEYPEETPEEFAARQKYDQLTDMAFWASQCSGVFSALGGPKYYEFESRAKALAMAMYSLAGYDRDYAVDEVNRIRRGGVSRLEAVIYKNPTNQEEAVQQTIMSCYTEIQKAAEYLNSLPKQEVR